MSSGSEIKYEVGLTWRSWLAILFSACFLMPIVLFYQLVAGQSGIDPAVYITAILFSEIARLFGSQMKKQEVCVIFNTVGQAVAGTAFLGLLFNGYLTISPLTSMFVDPFTKRPMNELIPWWYAPPRDSEVYILRTFFHSDWLGPIIVLALFSVFGLLQNIPLTMISAQLYIETENLPFPLASIDASIIETLAERSPVRTLAFTLSGIVGLIWGFITYTVPAVSQGIYGLPATIIPIPWADLTHWTEQVIPGAAIGFATDLMPYMWGMFLPGSIIAWMVISSVAIWIVGNNLVLKVFPSSFPKWAEEYTQGMNISLIYQRSTLWVWASPFIGLTIAVGIYPMVKHYKAIVQSFRSLSHLSLSSRRAGYLPLKVLMAMYVAGSIGSIALFYYCIPDFPLYIVIILVAVYSFFMSLITGRMVGETGFSISVPYVWQASILASGYPKIDAWLLAPPIITGTPVATLKVFQLTETRPMDFFKAWVLILPLSLVMSFIYVSLFWSMAPIPSGFYPATSINWPVSVIQTGIWATRQINIFRPNLILWSMIIVFVIAAVFDFLPIPFSLMGFAVGTTMLPPTSFAFLIGYLIGKYFFQRRFGRELWDSIRPVVAGGIVAGEGVALGIGAAAVVVAKSLWALPY